MTNITRSSPMPQAGEIKPKSTFAKIFFPYKKKFVSLQSLSIGNSVTSIGGYTFNGCSGLTSVTIGGSVEKIEDKAFRGCIHLRTINCRAEYPPICASGTFTDVPRYADVIVPCGAAYRYEASDY